MHWTDRGIVLSARRHGETSLIVQLLTEAHGRHAGLVRGGGGSKQRALYQPGNILSAAWRGRLADHLGALVCEPVRTTAALYLADADRLAALSSACALVEAALPERLPYPDIFKSVMALIDALAAPYWAGAYVRWEVAMLAALGFGLDLDACAATGSVEALTYVSPKTGRAVSAGAGAPFADRLLTLPAFLAGGEAMAPAPSPAGIGQGLALTGYFLERHVFGAHGLALPAARRRLADRFAGTGAPIAKI